MIVLGKDFARYFLWLVVFYITGVMFVLVDHDQQVTTAGLVVRSFGVIIFSGLSAYGAASLIRDIVKGRVRESIKEFRELIKK